MHKGALITTIFFLCFNFQTLTDDPFSIFPDQIVIPTNIAWRRCQEEIWVDLWVSQQGNSLNIYVIWIHWENTLLISSLSQSFSLQSAQFHQSSVCRAAKSIDVVNKQSLYGINLQRNWFIVGTIHYTAIIIIADFQEKRLKENLSKLSVKRDKRANIEDYFCQRLNVGNDICQWHLRLGQDWQEEVSTR